MLGSGLAEAQFRDGQEEAIQHVVEGRGRLLVVQRTGWGKSFVYFIATKLLRESGAGPALLISPLLALMRNQLEAAARMGVRAATVNSSNEAEWCAIEHALENDQVDILLISPERLANEEFQTNVLSNIARRISLLVVDEAHCISDWGHDFRPHYRLLERTTAALPNTVRLLATTATANNRVTDDLREILGPDLDVLSGDLTRGSLSLQTIRLPDQAQRLAWLAEQIPSLPGSGIVYALTVRDTEQIAAWLKSEGVEAEAYSGQIDADRREALERALLGNQLKVLVATTALGMGFDKPDLCFVVHFQTPGSPISYYQQVGRAGRAVSRAYGVLLSGDEDDDINSFFIESAFPTRDEVQSVLDALHAHPSGLSVDEILVEVNLSKARVQKTIELLSLESPAPLAKAGTKWQLTAALLSDDFWSRAERLTTLRRAEQRQMQEYVDLASGHMSFLLNALDSDTGRRGFEPSLDPLPTIVSPEAVRRAVEFLRRTSLPVAPRKKWPPGGLPQYGVQGAIAKNERAQSGKALCVWGDAGWGHLVRDGKYADGRFCDELVSASAQLVKDWNPEPAIAWVTCVPSLRRPDLLPDFARRLAAALGLPFAPSLAKTDERPEQKSRANSTQQARNVDGALRLVGEALPPGPVLLVDDVVDSRWTLTVSTWLLLQGGVPTVWPMALATMRGGS